MRVGVICLTFVMLASACDPSEGETPISQRDTTSAAAARGSRGDTMQAGTHSDGGALSDSAWTHEAQSNEHDGGGIAVVAAVREAEHEGFDRIVIEFRDGILPGYTVSHPTEKITECGSGHEVDLESSKSLEIRIEPARAYTEEGESTVSHADRSPALPAVEEIRVICDFEAMFTLAAGTAGRLPFRVLTLESPARLVVDVRHPSH